LFGSEKTVKPPHQVFFVSDTLNVERYYCLCSLWNTLKVDIKLNGRRNFCRKHFSWSDYFYYLNAFALTNKAACHYKETPAVPTVKNSAIRGKLKYALKRLSRGR